MPKKAQAKSKKEVEIIEKVLPEPVADAESDEESSSEELPKPRGGGGRPGGFSAFAAFSDDDDDDSDSDKPPPEPKKKPSKKDEKSDKSDKPGKDQKSEKSDKKKKAKDDEGDGEELASMFGEKKKKKSKEESAAADDDPDLSAMFGEKKKKKSKAGEQDEDAVEVSSSKKKAAAEKAAAEKAVAEKAAVEKAAAEKAAAEKVAAEKAAAEKAAAEKAAAEKAAAEKAAAEKAAAEKAAAEKAAAEKAAAEKAASAEKAKGKKGKKKAVQSDDEDSDEEPQSKGKQDKKKGGRRAADSDDDEEDDKPEAKAPAKGKKTQDKKKGGRQAADSDDDEEDDKPEAKAPAKGKKTQEEPAATKGAKDKKKADKAAEDADFDALLGEFQDPAAAAAKDAQPSPKAKAAPKQEAKKEEPAGKKGKDKKKADKAADDADFDALLGEFQADAPVEAPKAEPKAEENKDEDKEEEDESKLDAKTLKNRKLKEKKKAQAAAKKAAGGGMWGTEGAPEAAEKPEAAAAEAPPAPAKETGKPKAAAKKESAAVRLARERAEAMRQAEEERRAIEEQRRREEEEERRLIEEEKRLAEERAAHRREAKKAKIEKAKQDGTYETKKDKENRKRAEMLRQMYGFVMEKAKDNEEGDEAAEKGKRSQAARIMPGKKKKPVAKKEEAEEEERQEQETEQVATKEEEEEPAPKVEESKKPAEEAEDDGDDWEKAADEIDSSDEKAKDGSDPETKESGSDSDSSSSSDSDSSDDFQGYRSPIICIMGHVDTGKTKLLDKIRHTNVQEGEAGGITQQIGATFFPDIALHEQTQKVEPDFDIEVPGLLIIDTPGHESFNNLRKRGSSLCDLAILVIDIMHGLENMTVESLKMLQSRRCPFIVALNKIDRVGTKWNTVKDCDARSALNRQDDFHRNDFEKRYKNILLQLNSHGLNCALWWENSDFRSTVSIVPTSAVTGEGVPDLLYMIMHLAQTIMPGQLEVQSDFSCSVIEVKNIEGLGTTIDVILISGTLKKGDQIVVAGVGGPLVTTVRALKTPQPLKEMRVKGDYIDHEEINVSMGIKICAPGLENAVAGTELYVVGEDDDLDELKEGVQEDVDSILANFEKKTEGVFVKASTLGSLEALIQFLEDMKIPVFDVDIGEVQKIDVKKAMIMKEKKHPEYAVILAFDVKVNSEAAKQAAKDGVEIMTADIIYHLFEKFTKYMEEQTAMVKTEKRAEAVFPVILKIDKGLVFRKQDPFIFGCDVIGGQLRIGTPICVPEKENLEIGRVKGIEKDKGKPLQIARRGDKVCVSIEPNTQQKNLAFGRHFNHENQLYSKISRSSIDTLKENFKDEMEKDDWSLVVSMKQVFKIE